MSLDKEIIDEEFEKKGTIVKNKHGRLFFIVGSRRVRCEGKTELRQATSDFIREL